MNVTASRTGSHTWALDARETKRWHADGPDGDEYRRRKRDKARARAAQGVHVELVDAAGVTLDAFAPGVRP